MNFVEKKTIHDRLLGVTHMDADRELLGKLVPGHKLVSKRTFNPQSDASSLLWALLDYANEDDIVKHRREVAAKRISVSKESSEELPDASESENESAESSDSDAAETSETSPVAADNSMAASQDNTPVSDSALDNMAPNEAEVSCVDDPKNEVQSQQDLSKVADKKKSQKSSNTPK